MVLISLLIQAMMLLPRSATDARQQDSVKSSVEQEMRAALCELDSRAYDAANKRLQRLLQSDPNNPDVQKLILASLAGPIKPGDRSAGNVARIRSTIAAYQQAMTSAQLTANEKERIDQYIPFLYSWISKDEQYQELQRRAADTARTSKQRSQAYSVLGSHAWDCSFSITENPENKVANSGTNGAPVSYRKPKRQQDFDSAQTCVKSGLEDVKQAIALDSNNDSAWSYRGNLMLEAAKLAEMEGDPTRQAAYKEQSEAALKIARELSDKLDAQREKEWAEADRARRDREPLTPESAAAMTKELVNYRRENSLADAIDHAFMPNQIELSALVAPVPIAEDKPAQPTEKSATPPATNARRTPVGCFREVDGPAQIEAKRSWKSFTTIEADLTVDLPDNVCESSGGYVAASEGVMYSIIPIPRPSIASSAVAVDGTLNTLVRTFAGTRSNIWLGEGAGNIFEMKLISKEQAAGEPRKLYAYTRSSCSVRKESVLLVLATRAHFYTIDISGAKETDAQVQQFLGSLRVK